MNSKLITAILVGAVVLGSVSTVVTGCGGSSHSNTVDQTQTLSNLKAVGLALAQYTEDYDEQLPSGTTSAAIDSQLLSYNHDSSIFIDPNNKVPFAWNASLSGKSPDIFPDVSLIMTFYDEQPPVQDSIPVLLLNGQAHTETSAQFAQLKSTSGIP